jgi:hypothetical protein
MTRPPDRFTDRVTTWEGLADWIETGEGRQLGGGEEQRLYQLFTAFLPEHRSDYPHSMSRLEVWYERQQAFMDLQQYVDEAFPGGDYDLSEYIDDEADWRTNYEQIPG